MTNSTAINYQALREIAKHATQGEWVAFISTGTGTYAVHTPGDKRCEDVIKWTGFDGQKNAENNARYIAAFNPEVVQALLNEREAQSKRIAELEASCAALAAENARLKAGAMYFSYGSEFSFECHKTAEEAIAAAEAAIDDYRGDACDGWSEEVESICWGVIIQQATKVGERKKRKCDRVSPWIERVCDYELRPNVETPATDAFLAEVRAEARNEGINYTASRLAAAFNHGFINKSLREVFDVTRMILSAKEELANEPHPIDGLSGEYAEKSLEEWAEQIRKGGDK
ncbi:ead/Ea22-like family protein (plasmid) [Escherichia albertii]|uniref:ead/Ea22-like family protein n=1 Tax=Escherichia TaxID=561 RepID=UPI000530B2DB|nr:MULTISPECIES: ead/Ea22-like family protein [Escherichia]EBF2083545.1 ead/Ea22-like family protein [Salmonella enterica]EGP3689438.1 ead/Ea22-like family protein [Escherichia coli]EKL5071293.1 ead/Ea22-like family protein [Escherichia coli]MBS8689323.1 ead/Ea22-like family protein [Escherichia coli]MBS8722214.1 ead/Ea22-like family protein [Escherichia coli]